MTFLLLVVLVLPGFCEIMVMEEELGVFHKHLVRGQNPLQPYLMAPPFISPSPLLISFPLSLSLILKPKVSGWKGMMGKPTGSLEWGGSLGAW